MMLERFFRARDTASDFNVSNFYYFANAVSPNKTLSAGYKVTSGEVNMTKYVLPSFPSPKKPIHQLTVSPPSTRLSSYSSENWQLYHQNGRYFIRNRDFGATLQLGIQDSNKQTPRLYPSSGALGQQWTIKKTADGKGWTLSNGLLGETSLLALTNANGPPTMQTSDDATVWDIHINERCVLRACGNMGRTRRKCMLMWMDIVLGAQRTRRLLPMWTDLLYVFSSLFFSSPLFSSHREGTWQELKKKNKKT